MIKDMERFERLRSALHVREARLSELENDLKAKQTKQRELDDEALKAEILEQKDLKQKKRIADENRETIKASKAEIEKCKEAIEILKREDEGIKREALKELRIHFRPQLEKSLKEFYEKLKELNEAEIAVKKVRKEAEAEATRLGISSGLGLENSGPPDIFTLENPPGSDFYPMKSFVERCKMNGFNVE